MKTFFALITFLLLVSTMHLSAQDIQNSGFENWSTVQYYEDPVGYHTTNGFTFFAGSNPNVTRITNAVSGSYAIQMETVDTPEGIYKGAAFIGQPEDNTFLGGMPYNDRPDSLTGYAKFDVASTDTAYVAAVFKKLGVPIGISFVQFTGVQEEYQYFSVAVEWLVPIISPDTLAIALISSSIFAEPVVGSNLSVDMIEFKGPGDPFPNGDFEDWIEFSSEEADDWQSSNLFSLIASSISLTKSNDSHSGNFAARIESQLTGFNDTLGFITNGYIGEDGPAGGMPVENIPNILSGYYKYFPVGQDTAIGGMTLYRYNENSGETEVLDSAFIKLAPAETYIYFEVPVEYNTWPEPDTVNIAFGSSNFDESVSNIGLGSTLYLDDLEITYKPNIVSVNDPSYEAEPNVYPNPADDVLFIETFQLIHQDVSVKIFDSNGQLIRSQKRKSQNNFNIPVDDLVPGIYFYSIEMGEKTHKGKFIIK